MMSNGTYTFCCACACNQGIVCDHPGKPHEYCANHDPADYFGTATQRGCDSCAALRARVAVLEKENSIRDANGELFIGGMGGYEGCAVDL